MEPESNFNSKNVEVERQRSSLYFVTRGVLGDRYALLGAFMLLVFLYALSLHRGSRPTGLMTQIHFCV